MQNFLFTRLKLVALYMECLEKSRKDPGIGKEMMNKNKTSGLK